jgi:hypothetical protein
MKTTLEAVLLALTFGVTTGCASGSSSVIPYMDIWPANYTENFIQDFTLESNSGQRFMLKGYDVATFSRGGSSDPACCSDLPGVGSKVRLVWRTGDRYAPESEWVTHSAWVQIKGITSNTPGTHPFLIARFFAHDQAELEYTVRSDDPFAPITPRVDGLFRGERVMRQPGE